MGSKQGVTIIVVTRNRPHSLRKMLQETKKQVNCAHFEIMVANDGSKTDPEGIVRESFPDAEFFNARERKGPAEWKNSLFKKARGEFVFFLDDDSWFENEGAIIRAVGLFEKYPRSGILSFRVRLPDGTLRPPATAKKEPYEAGKFIGCAHAVRKSFFEGADIYDADYFRQGEERDLAIMCLDKGYNVLQVNSISVFHEETKAERDHQFIHGYAFRNELFFYLKYFPAILAVIFMVKCVISHTIFCLRKGWFRAYSFGLADFVKGFSGFLRKRRPVKLKTVKKYVCLNMLR